MVVGLGMLFPWKNVRAQWYGRGLIFRSTSSESRIVIWEMEIIHGLSQRLMGVDGDA